MTIKNREVIGTVECKACKQIATVHQVQGGNRKGQLFTKGCGCATNQSNGAFIQKYWRENTVPKAGFEHLFNLESESAANLDEPVNQPANDETPESASDGDSIGSSQVESTSKKPLIIGALLLLVGGVAAVAGLKK